MQDFGFFSCNLLTNRPAGNYYIMNKGVHLRRIMTVQMSAFIMSCSPGTEYNKMFIKNKLIPGSKT